MSRRWWRIMLAERGLQGGENGGEGDFFNGEEDFF